jgi:hypothetical protein
MAKSTGSSARTPQRCLNGPAPKCVRADLPFKSDRLALDPSLKSWVDKILVPAMVREYIAEGKQMRERVDDQAGESKKAVNANHPPDK